MKRSDIYNGHIPTKRIGSPAPTSVKEQLWEKSYLIYFRFDGQDYYIDTRHDSPFGFEYDFWSDNGPNKLQHRITGDELPKKLTNYVNRKKKIDKILGNID